LFRDVIANDRVGQFALPALIDAAYIRPQHDREYKHGSGNGGSILSIYAHDEPPILKHPRTHAGLQGWQCYGASRKSCVTRITQAHAGGNLECSGSNNGFPEPFLSESASPQSAEIGRARRHIPFVPILLQKLLWGVNDNDSRSPSMRNVDQLMKSHKCRLCCKTILRVPACNIDLRVWRDIDLPNQSRGARA
jgi:hypothetical protein